MGETAQKSGIEMTGIGTGQELKKADVPFVFDS